MELSSSSSAGGAAATGSSTTSCAYFDHATNLCYESNGSIVSEDDVKQRHLSLKEQKEAFVTGHNGSSALEIFFICLVPPIGIFLCIELQSYYLRRVKSTTKEERAPKNIKYGSIIVTEIICLWLPMLLSQTCIFMPYGCLMLFGLFAFALYHKLHHNGETGQTHTTQQPNGDPHQHPQQQLSQQQQQERRQQQPFDFLTYYRSTVLIMTVIAILAVDFTIFPRRYAKTEINGYSLMDIGAISFIISAGFVSSYARCSHTKTNNHKNTLFRSLMRSIPIGILGLIRLIVNKSANYQEHVSEYGVHWNFFLTLALVGPMATLYRIIQNKMKQKHDIASRTSTSASNTSSSKNNDGGADNDNNNNGGANNENNKSATNDNNKNGVNNDNGKVVDMIFFALPWLYMIIYERFLTKWGLQQMIETAPRSYRHPSSINFFAILNKDNVVHWVLGHYLQFVMDLFYANREGILGCFSYLCVFCMSEEIGRFCLWSGSHSPSSQNTPTRDTSSSLTIDTNDKKINNDKKDGNETNAIATNNHNNDMINVGVRLYGTTLALWKLHFLLVGIYDIQVSRRSTNIGFMTWSLAQNTTLLFFIWVVWYSSTRSQTCRLADNAVVSSVSHSAAAEAAEERKDELNEKEDRTVSEQFITTSQPNNDTILPIFKAVNDNGLLVFLLANILTGLINISINTLEITNHFIVIMILSIYLGIIACASSLLSSLKK